MLKYADDLQLSGNEKEGQVRENLSFLNANWYDKNNKFPLQDHAFFLALLLAQDKHIYYVEKQLPGQFDRYSDNPVMRVVKITPGHAGFIVLATGEGYVIDFEKHTAFPVKLEK